MSGDLLAGADELFGLFLSRPGELVPRKAAESGFRFLIIDGEHGSFDESDYSVMIHLIRDLGLLSFVRLPDHGIAELKRRVAEGADVIVAPQVSTVAEAGALVDALLTASPGSSAGRASPGFIALIESAAGVENAEAILAMDGVLGAFIGPHDLSVDLGHPGDFSRPGYRSAVEQIERAARATGKLLGTAPHAEFSLARLRAAGHRLLVLGSDEGIVGDAMSSAIRRS